MKKKAGIGIASVIITIIAALGGTLKFTADRKNNDNNTPTTTFETVTDASTVDTVESSENTKTIFSIDNLPEYSDNPYVVINNNVPFFTKEEITNVSYEFYSDLDTYGRCGVTIACIGKDLMPTEPRGDIGSVKPTGWVSAKYDFVDGKYLYNRCHLIGFQLTGENANKKNLITGTRYLNVDGMLPFENMVADYIKETNNHVMYRVTPIFNGNNLVADGVLMEAKSVEDDGEGILYCVFCYNVQPGVIINYATGESMLASQIIDETTENSENNEKEYIININSKKFHNTDCSGIKDIKEENKKTYRGTRQKLIDEGYIPCKECNP